MITFFNYFVKLTGWFVQKIIFRTKISYEDKSVQSRKIKGPAVIISNHTSVYDYVVCMFTFPFRTLRYQMAEVLFKKKLLGLFLKMLGGIKVDRYTGDAACVEKSIKILKKGGVVGVFPESRLPKTGEETPLPFKQGAAYLALYCNVPVIPVYLSGGYFGKNRAEIIIGKPLNVYDFVDDSKDDKENLTLVSERLRNKIIDLGKLLKNEER